jgi:CIC family chloride channel protein
MMKRQTKEEEPIEGKKESAVRSEIQDYLDERQQRRWIFPRAALVGGCAGAVALGFRVVLTESDLLRNNLITWAHTLPFLGWLFPVVLTFLGAGISVAITRRFAPEASGSGIPHLEAVLHRYRKLD